MAEPAAESSFGEIACEARLRREDVRVIELGDQIVVVSGVPRSGTSLAMQMLAAAGVPILSDAERPADESNPRGYFELAAVARSRSDLSWIEGARGRAVKLVHALLPLLPAREKLTYRVIFMRRDTREVLASQRRMLERLGRGDAADERVLGEALARQCAAVLAGFARRADARVIQIEHRSAIFAPREAAVLMAEHLEQPLDVEAMARCVDLALYRERAALEEPGAPGSAASTPQPGARLR